MIPIQCRLAKIQCFDSAQHDHRHPEKPVLSEVEVESKGGMRNSITDIPLTKRH
jgi:hypothetical protein